MFSTRKLAFFLCLLLSVITKVFSANLTGEVLIGLGYITRDPPFGSHFSARTTPQNNFAIIIEVEGLSSQEGENWNQVVTLKTLNKPSADIVRLYVNVSQVKPLSTGTSKSQIKILLTKMLEWTLRGVYRVWTLTTSLT